MSRSLTAAVDFGFLLDGKWRTSSDRVEILSPGTGERVGSTYRANAADAEAAIASAVRAFQITRKMGGFEAA